MDTPHGEVSSFEAQLTLARWHLDAVFSAPGVSVRDHLARARQAYDSLLVALPALATTNAQRAIELQLAALRSRLEEAEAAVP